MLIHSNKFLRMHHPARMVVRKSKFSVWYEILQLIQIFLFFDM